VARLYGLGFLPLRTERYDFAIPSDRWDLAPVAAFRNLLAQNETRVRLVEFGFDPQPELAGA
jgi:molybdate-binding protein